jgi:hypothetical protein
MGLWKRSVVAIGLVLASFAGLPIAMMADVQRAEPLYTDRFAGEYQTLSACNALAWSRVKDHNVWDLHQIIDPPNRTAVVQGNYRVFMSAYPMEATLQQIDDATVQIDVRQTPGADVAPEWVWRAVEECVRQMA